MDASGNPAQMFNSPNGGTVEGYLGGGNDPRASGGDWTPAPPATGPAPGEAVLDQPLPSETWQAEQNNFFGSDINNPQRTGQVFDDFDYNQQSNQENIFGSDPGLDTYYDEQRKRGFEGLGNQFAAQGFGSSAHGDSMGLFASDLAGRQAFQEADFRQRQAEGADSARLDRYGMGGHLGGTADTSDLGYANADTSRRMAGTNAANIASSAEMDRYKTSFDMQRQLADMYSGLFMDGSDDIIGANERFLEGELEGELAGGATDLSTAQGDDAQTQENLSNLARIANLPSASAGPASNPYTQPRPMTDPTNTNPYGAGATGRGY